MNHRPDIACHCVQVRCISSCGVNQVQTLNPSYFQQLGSTLQHCSVSNRCESNILGRSRVIANCDRMRRLEDSYEAIKGELDMIRELGRQLEAWKRQIEAASAQVAAVLDLTQSDNTQIRYIFPSKPLSKEPRRWSCARISRKNSCVPVLSSMWGCCFDQFGVCMFDLIVAIQYCQVQAHDFHLMQVSHNVVVAHVSGCGRTIAAALSLRYLGFNCLQLLFDMNRTLH